MTGPGNVKVNISGIKAGRDRLRQLARHSVKVGIQSDAGEYENGMRLVDIAIMQAYGTVVNGKVHIPARPFLQEAVRRYRSRISDAAKKLAAKVAKGEMPPEMALGQLGLLMTACVQRTLRDGPWVPLSPATIAKKKSNVPLIDTGFLVNSIRHEVVST